jgi:hypothetical protein
MVCPVLVTSPVEGSFSSKRLCRDLTARGIEAHGFPTFEAMRVGAPALCRKGDVIIISFCMGNECVAQQLAEQIASSVSQRT